jgi:hypothetical protein
LAAIGQASGSSRGGRHFDGGQIITPILNWGLPVYPAPQPVVIVLQQPPPTFVTLPAPETRDEVDRAEAAIRLPPASPAPATSPAELGQFILIRHDGQVILAVAFSVSKDRLTYITKDGNRRFFPYAQLDVDATQQMNEAAGTTVILPN